MGRSNLLSILVSFNYYNIKTDISTATEDKNSKCVNSKVVFTIS